MRAFLIVLAACGGSLSKDVEVKPGGIDASRLAACARGDVQKELAIVGELRDSYHEMIVCGGLALDFNRAVVGVLVNAAVGSKTAPDAVTYVGNGTYASANGMMWMRTMRASDGAPLEFPILDLESYVVGGKVNADLAVVARALKSKDKAAALGDVELDVSMTREGPALALLEVPSDAIAAKRFTMTPKRAAELLGSRAQVANRIDVKDEHGGTEVHYVLDGKPQLVKGVLENKAVPMELSSITATRAATKQTIRITEWTMQFEGDGARVLDGTIGVNVDGGAFPYAARFVYGSSAEPAIELACR